MVKVLFFGTPQIAVPTLEWLSQHTTVVGVVCRSDEPVGRGGALTAPPAKIFAEAKKIPVFQPEGPWTEEVVRSLRELKADLGIVVAYGRLMPEPVFTAPKFGCVNLHFSLLPKYRGAAPMQWSLINGETKTGVTAFWLEAGLDSGPIFHQKEIGIEPDDDAPRLREKLVRLGLAVLEDVIKDVEAARIVRKPQLDPPTFAPLLKKEHGRIDWHLNAARIVNLIHGVCEWPGAVAHMTAADGTSKQLKILKAALVPEAPSTTGKTPGTVTEAIKDRGIVVQAGEGRVLLLEVQAEGKKAMPAWTFWQGARMKVGDTL